MPNGWPLTLILRTTHGASTNTNASKLVAARGTRRRPVNSNRNSITGTIIQPNAFGIVLPAGTPGLRVAIFDGNAAGQWDQNQIPNGPDGLPAISYLKSTAFDDIARFFGFQGNYLYSYAMYDINPNDVAAFPSLHAAYPTLAFLFTQRAFGRVGYLMVGYAACVWFAVVYLGDHYLVDVLAAARPGDSRAATSARC